MNKEDKVNVPEEVVVSREELNVLTASLKRQAEEIQILKASVSEAKQEQAARELNLDKVDRRKRGHLKRLNNQVVLRWKNAKDSELIAKNGIVFDGATPVGEVLKGHYITLDGGEIICDYRDFIRSNDLEYFRVLNEDLVAGEHIWEIEFENPELNSKYGTVSVPVRFVNP